MILELFEHWLEENQMVMLLDYTNRPVGALYPSRIDSSKIVINQNNMSTELYMLEYCGVVIFFSNYKKIEK